jgi:hypothetical protein
MHNNVKGVNAMNFGLSKKYSEIDFEEVSVSDLMLIGGGCGESSGGSSGVTVASAQAAQQQAASAPGSNTSVNVTYVAPSVGATVTLNWGVGPAGGYINGTANVQANNGTVKVEASHTTSSSETHWYSGITSFFSWLFGSH